MPVTDSSHFPPSLVPFLRHGVQLRKHNGSTSSKTTRISGGSVVDISTRSRKSPLAFARSSLARSLSRICSASSGELPRPADPFASRPGNQYPQDRAGLEYQTPSPVVTFV